MSPSETSMAAASATSSVAAFRVAAIGEKAMVSARFRRAPDIIRFAILASADVAALFCAGSMSYLLWARPLLHQSAALYLELLPLIALFPLIYGVTGLYPGFGLGAVETVRRLSYGTSLGFLLLAAAEFSFKVGPLYSRAAYAISWVLGLLLLPLTRFLILSLVSQTEWWGEPTLVIDSRANVEKTIRQLNGARSLGYHIVGAFCSGAVRGSSEIADIPILGNADSVFRFADSGATTILVCADARNVDVRLLQRRFQRVVTIGFDRTLPVEQARVRNFGSTIGIEFHNQMLLSRNRLMKRALDVTMGVTLLILAIPLIALGGLLITLASRGPIFFRQRREGFHGRTITLWKIRTMYVDAERVLDECLNRDNALRDEWDRRLKLARDPRIVRFFGTVLRRLSIDELPQLLNVVRGEMSLVGPRPFPDYHLGKFSAEFRQLRNSVRPGLSGMWQVMIRSDGSTAEQELYDSYYIRNWSLWLDVYILAKTAIAVLSTQGAS